MSPTPDHDPIDDELTRLGVRLRSDGERRPADVPDLGGRIHAGRQRARLALSATCVVAVLVVAMAVGVGAGGSTDSLQVGDGASLIGDGTTPGTGPPGSTAPPGTGVSTTTVPAPSEEPPTTVPVPASVPLPEDEEVAVGPAPDGTGTGTGTAGPGVGEPPVWPREDPCPGVEFDNLHGLDTWAVRIEHDGTTSPYERMIDERWPPSIHVGNYPASTWPVYGENRVMVYWQGSTPRQAAERVRDAVATWPGVTSAEVGHVDLSLPHTLPLETRCDVPLPPAPAAPPIG